MAYKGPMDNAPASPITVLDAEDCWDILSAHELGRIVTVMSCEPEIFPVNYVVDGGCLVFRTGEGSKLFFLTVNSQVAFQVDHWDAHEGVSVIARGEAEVLTSRDDIAHAETLPLHSWVPTVKTTFVRIVVHSVTGRQFQFGDAPA